MYHLSYKQFHIHLRITECLRLRVQDIGFNDGSVTVRNGKGNKDRKTMLSQRLHNMLHQQIDGALSIQQADNLKGVGPSLPYAIGKNTLMPIVNRPGCLCSRPSACANMVPDACATMKASQPQAAGERNATGSGCGRISLRRRRKRNQMRCGYNQWRRRRARSD